jgi:hypothetical protein
MNITQLVCIYLLTVLFTVTSCSTLDVIKGALPALSEDKGLSVETQIGDKNTKVESNSSTGSRDIKAKGNSTVTVSSAKTDNEVQTAEKVFINNGPSPWLLSLLILGWVCPTPRMMFLSVQKRFKDKNGK